MRDADDTPEGIDPREDDGGERSDGVENVSLLAVEQALSDRDRAGSNRDQEASDRDQEASEEDQLVSTQEAAGGADQKVRDLGAQHREHATSVRDAQVHERRQAAEDRARAAKDRARAAEERNLSAHDRALAARDRAQAALDREASEVDELTRVRRRGPGMRQLQREIDRACRTSEELVVVFADVDHLKAVNDSEGHPAGDALLMSVSDSLRQCLRSYDLIMRYGGDEFVCALPNVDLADARRRFEEVAAVLAAAPVKSSITVGFAELREECPAGELIGRADEDLLARRAGGRD